jgi:histidine triad (HIT) family protein
VTDCIFCRIASGEIPAKVVKRTADAVAFHDLNPQAPVHVLVIPTRHLTAARDARGEEGTQLLGRTLAFATEVATELGLDAGGYRIVTNSGADGGQTVLHLHFHLLGGRRMTWPPG